LGYSKTASIFYNSILSDGKANLVGAFGRFINIKFPIVFKSARKNNMKIKEKRNFTRNPIWFLVQLLNK